MLIAQTFLGNVVLGTPGCAALRSAGFAPVLAADSAPWVAAPP